VVADDFSGKGMGSRLMLSIMDVARDKGLAEIEGLVLANNPDMLKLMRNLGFSIKAYPDDPEFVVVDKPLRSGQQVYARGADLVVLAMVSFGAEVIADGNIHVYAPLRGRAIAGARGNTEARIFCTCLEPQLVSIAGIYRTTETALPDSVRGKPAQVRLDGEKLIIEPLA
jgi:septum site-determining protein MinC